MFGFFLLDDFNIFERAKIAFWRMQARQKKHLGKGIFLSSDKVTKMKNYFQFLIENFKGT